MYICVVLAACGISIQRKLNLILFLLQFRLCGVYLYYQIWNASIGMQWNQ